MSRFALVALPPQAEDDPSRLDFVSHEFASPAEVAELLASLEEHWPRWRVVQICHVEDLPLLMEPPLAPPPEGGS